MEFALKNHYSWFACCFVSMIVYDESSYWETRTIFPTISLKILQITEIILKLVKFTFSS